MRVSKHQALAIYDVLVESGLVRTACDSDRNRFVYEGRKRRYFAPLGGGSGFFTTEWTNDIPFVIANDIAPDLVERVNQRIARIMSPEQYQDATDPALKGLTLVASEKIPQMSEAEFSNLLDEVADKGNPVVLTVDGVPKTVLVPVEWYQRLHPGQP